ncbi:MAG TPA: VTT domain-containing protein [Candidatus Paceibacterota bacterium]|nr:VTT domain-containing protein [Candidatus Paceibacterota bacterium]
MPHLALVPIVQAIGYPGLFAAIFLESGVFFGFFLPGASLLFTAGLLASKGVFSVWILIALLTLAAILGDNAGYWFGAKIGVRLFLRPDSRFFKHEHIERAKDFYDKHGARTIILARFVPIVRTFVPIVAGVVRMRYSSFISYNIIGALAWAAGITFLGYYLGAKVPFVSQYLTPIILLIIVVTSLPLLWELRNKT